MSTNITIEKTKPSSLRRLPFLPRFGFVLELGGIKISYRQAPLLEAFLNLPRGKRSLEKFLGVSLQQLREIDFSRLQEVAIAEAAGPKARAKKKRRPKRI